MAEGQSVQWIEVAPELAGQRIDNFLRTRLKGAPKALIYRIVRKGEVRVNKKRIKVDYRLQAGDLVRVPPLRLSPEAAVQEVSGNLREVLSGCIVRETDDFMVINKPSGLAVHGGSGVKIGLIEAMRQIRDELPFLELVHRLDRDTSGCILLAKTRAALLQLNADLKAHKMTKLYLALVEGRWDSRRDYVNAPLERYDGGNGERRVRVDEAGKTASTRYAVREAYPSMTLVEAEPITGRTHQIRVHSVHAGHPLLGDTKYGTERGNALAKKVGLERLFLHAAQLSFPDPTDGRTVTVRAPLDKRMKRVLANARELGARHD
ncbi:RluA family pseudouridine synthase [Cobetia marina]|uniref:RluA family pseudouridine synthase n=1 Tax=Cobetia marina TaxID=28258 RepID=UPI0017493E1A